MKTFFYRSAVLDDSLLYGSWKKIISGNEKYIDSIILRHYKTGKILCPVHCRWEDCTIDDEFSITCPQGKKSSGIIISYKPKSDVKNAIRNRGVILKKHIFGKYLFYSEEDYLDSLSYNFFKDIDNVDQNIYLYEIDYDEKGCSCSVSTRELDVKWLNKHKEGNFLLSKIRSKKATLHYDLRNPTDENSGELKSSVQFNKFYADNNKRCAPESVDEYIEQVSQILVNNFAGRKIRINNNYFHGINLLKALSYYPYEANMLALKADSKSCEVLKKLNRESSNIYNEWCREFWIESFTQLRKEFEKNPCALLSYRTLFHLGFRNKNIMLNAIKKYDFTKIPYSGKNAAGFLFFCAKSIPLRGEKATLHALVREPWLADALRQDLANMFVNRYEQLAPPEREAILYGGFTEENHDLLSKICNNIKNKNITFEYSKYQKQLEDKIGDYEFLLPKDSDEMHQLGAAMNNCVYSYVEKVVKKGCTIVYAVCKGSYSICIEVSDHNTVTQAYAHHNSPTKGEDKKIFDQWCRRHSLKQ